MIQFDLPKEQSSIIKVIGIGGGGSNAVNYMYNLGIEGVNYVICNTDNQALETSDVPNKIQLGSNLRNGLGAGSKPEVGREATEEAMEQIEEILQSNTKMVFITAGMGGGTGTGGAPVVARLAKDMGILTVAIVTTPFVFEGKKRLIQAEAGIAELKKEVDALLVISNDKLRDIHGNLRMSEAFSRADDILTVAAKGIAEIITKIGLVNVDFEDVNTVMRDSGVALMGIGTSTGENRAMEAVEEAMTSPLLNDNNIVGAKSVLLNVSHGKDELTMDEMGIITDYIQEAIGVESENLIFGYSEDAQLDTEIRVTLIATGFESEEQRVKRQKNVKVVHTLDHLKPQEDEPKLNQPVEEEQPEEHDETRPYLKTDEVSPSKQITFDFDYKPSSKSSDRFTPLDQQNVTEEPEVEEEVQEPHSNAKAVSMPFSLSQKNEDTEAVDHDQSTDFNTNATSNEDQFESKAKPFIDETNDERIERLKSFSVRLKNPEDLDKLENQPAYVRKNIELENSSKSENHEVSRYQLRQNEDGEFEISKNSFLHDNVD